MNFMRPEGRAPTVSVLLWCLHRGVAKVILQVGVSYGNFKLKLDPFRKKLLEFGSMIPRSEKETALYSIDQESHGTIKIHPKDFEEWWIKDGVAHLLVDFEDDDNDLICYLAEDFDDRILHRMNNINTQADELQILKTLGIGVVDVTNDRGFFKFGNCCGSIKPANQIRDIRTTIGRTHDDIHEFMSTLPIVKLTRQSDNDGMVNYVSPGYRNGSPPVRPTKQPCEYWSVNSSVCELAKCMLLQIHYVYQQEHNIDMCARVKQVMGAASDYFKTCGAHTTVETKILEFNEIASRFAPTSGRGGRGGGRGGGGRGGRRDGGSTYFRGGWAK
eukprot:GHVR01085124.1.p1 GENE.GHVR01085124.1~~GHVR01085124.1.p1  ORF type:complete len:330 (+),score=50.75 GHVR01085124.1:174-1163(+)